MSSLVAVIANQQMFPLPAATASPGFGAARQLNLQPGIYELRAVDGAIAVRDGQPPFTQRDLVVLPNVPIRVKVSGNTCAAASTTSNARLFATPLEAICGCR
jgi:hypothetical protein